MGVSLTNSVALCLTCLPVQIWANKYGCLSVHGVAGPRNARGPDPAVRVPDHDTGSGHRRPAAGALWDGSESGGGLHRRGLVAGAGERGARGERVQLLQQDAQVPTQI